MSVKYILQTKRSNPVPYGKNIIIFHIPISLPGEIRMFIQLNVNFFIKQEMELVA